LLEAINEAHNGGAPMSPEIARKVVTLFQKTGPVEKVNEALTPQEVRLLKLLSEAYSYQGAAERLNISVNTVRDYIRSIYEKLHVHSKSEAVNQSSSQPDHLTASSLSAFQTKNTHKRAMPLGPLPQYARCS